MKNQPQKIFLQIGEDADPETPFDQLSEVSWCEDRVFENDLEFVALDALKEKYDAVCQGEDIRVLLHFVRGLIEEA